MSYDPKAHHRRSIRWVGYDYAAAGAYFVTLCVQDRRCLFGEIGNDVMALNAAGAMVQATWNELSGHCRNVDIDTFVVMPNHVHAIIRLVGAGLCACPHDDTNGKGQPQRVAPTNAGRTDDIAHPTTLADVVRRFKSLTTRRYADGVSQQGWVPFGGRLWQRNYWEHVVRGEESLSRIRRYILDNPASWAFDEENPQSKFGRSASP